MERNKKGKEKEKKMKEQKEMQTGERRRNTVKKRVSFIP